MRQISTVLLSSPFSIRASRSILYLAASILAIVLFETGATAQTEKVLYRFTGGSDGGNPNGGVVLRGGNLFGTTQGGGVYGAGTVFELKRNQTGWSERVLYSFGNGADGGFPDGALVFDKSGNLYGTASGGGNTSGTCTSFGCGVVFELQPSSTGWTEKVLYAFTGGTDGTSPTSDLVFDTIGNLYGIVPGVVFELTPSGSAWNFTAIGNAGYPGSAGKLALDANRNVYGATLDGGNGNGCNGSTCGTVFELTPTGQTWTETTLFSFLPGTGGFDPYASVTIGPDGVLYGTTLFGGAIQQAGTVFELKQINGTWTERVLYAFTGGKDGGYPDTDVVFDKSGNLYSTAFGGFQTCGGQGEQCGVVFELTRSNGVWSEKVLHRFQPAGNDDGFWPTGTPILDSVGNLYNTTYYGGTNGNVGAGTVYEVTP
jgi:hypothetical protein